MNTGCSVLDELVLENWVGQVALVQLGWVSWVRRDGLGDLVWVWVGDLSGGLSWVN